MMKCVEAILKSMRTKVLFFVFALIMFCAGSTSVNAATNISATASDHWAWNDFIGWIDWYNTNTITVTSDDISGYASSSIEDISLDCATTRIGNICGTSNYKVLNDKIGNLSGWGWSDAYGWISFCGGQGTASCPGTTISYRTLIDGDTGEFSGYAWNDVIGWITFNCSNPPVSGLCSTSNFRVVTSWRGTSTIGVLDSATFDTGTQGGGQLNSFTWYGSLPPFTAVRFQFATATSSAGPWVFYGPIDTDDYYTNSTPGVAVAINYLQSTNQRYFRYRAVLVSNKAQTVSPRLDDIIINWSP